MPVRHALICWPLALALPAMTGAQSATPTATAATAQASAVQPAESKPAEKKIELSVEARWRFEWRNNADLQPAADFDGFSGQRIRINFKAALHSDFRLTLQPQDVWVWDANSDKVIHDQATNLHQAFFDWKPSGSKRFEFRLGRQELMYGEERLVGAFNWDNVGRSFDAARLRVKQGHWSSDFFWGRLVDVRRNGARRRAGKQDLSGGYFSRQPKGSPGVTEFYALFLRDSLPTRGEVRTVRESIRIFTGGFRRAYTPKSGWRYSLEHAWQAGKRGPDAHAAAMLIASCGYLWERKWKPRLGFEYDLASGDNNPADGHSGEFNNLFPTNHFFYGTADLVGLRNLHDFRFTLAASPHPKTTLEIDFHKFLLVSPRGPWKNAGGRVLGFDPTGNSGRDIGQEFDITVRVPVHGRVNLMGGFSAFWPGAFARATRGGEMQKWAFLMTTVRF
jgi:hypothetical protein